MTPDPHTSRLPLSGGDEQDALTGWRKMLCYLGRAGVAKQIKRKYQRRLRSKVRLALQQAETE